MKKASEEELFSYLQEEATKKALVEGEKDCARARDGNAHIVGTLREWIKDSPDVATPTVVATIVRQFSDHGGTHQIELPELLLLWAVALVDEARREVSAGAENRDG